jgi:dihydropteroate synthase
VKDTSFYQKSTLNCKGKLINLDAPKIMGILNITPDSFYKSSRANHENIVEKARKMIDDGTDFLDIGGFSSRPGAADISEEEELKRVIPAVELIAKNFPDILVSIDTFRSKVAREAVNAGACMINDISGGEADNEMFKTVADLKVPYILMHMRGTPATMQNKTKYNDLPGEIIYYFSKKIYELTDYGVNDIIIDPGFGFAKTIEQNYYLLDNLKDLSILKLPMLVGISRKGMVYKPLNVDPEQALNGTIVLNTIALLNNAKILRVHDVKQAHELINLFTFMRRKN